MTISFLGASTASTGTTTITTTIPAPTGSSTNDCGLVVVGNKPFSVTPTTTQATVGSSVTSGTTVSGAALGSVRATIARRSSMSTSSFGIPWTLTGNNIAIGRGLRFASTNTGTWDVYMGGLTDVTETGTAVSATTTASPPAGTIVAGDMIVIHPVIKSTANHTAQAISIPGCTVSAITWLAKGSTTTGDDISDYVGTATVTAGSSTDSITYTATSSVSGASATAVNFARVREPVAAAVEITGSGAIDALLPTITGTATATTPGTPGPGGAVTFTAGDLADSTASVTTLTPALPDGLVDGDHVLLLCTSNASGGGYTGAPTGYSTVLASTPTANGSTSGHLAVYYRRWVAGDANPTLTMAPGRAAVLPIKVSGADPDAFIDVAATVTQAPTSATAIDAPSITPGAAGALVTVHMARHASSGVFITWTSPAGMTEVGEAGSHATTATNASAVLSALDGVTAGAATGTKTATASATTTGAMGVSFTLKAAPAGDGSPITGAGALTAPTPTLSGTATHVKPSFIGVGALTALLPTASGTGTAVIPTFTGAASITAPLPTLTGTATRVHPSFIGAGALQSPLPAVAGTATRVHPSFIGAGALAAPLPGVTGAATFHIPAITASASLVALAPGVAGAATHVPPTFTGSSTQAALLPGISATGMVARPTFTGSGAQAAPLPALAGAATATKPVFTGSGALQSRLPVASGAGTTAAPLFTGSASLVALAPVASGTATHVRPTFTATASLTPGLPDIDARGGAPVPLFTGTGSIAAALPTATGSGTVALPVYVGSGAMTAARPSVTGSATHAAPFVTGSGGLIALMPGVTATGSVTAPIFSAAAELVAGLPAVQGSGTVLNLLFTAEGSLEALLPEIFGEITASVFSPDNPPPPWPSVFVLTSETAPLSLSGDREPLLLTGAGPDMQLSGAADVRTLTSETPLLALEGT